LAAVNGPQRLVVSGEAAAMADLQQQLQQAGIGCRWLAVERAFHSGMVEAIAAAYERALRRQRLRPPQQALVSTVTGRMAGAEMAEAAYWVEQMRRPVRWGDGLRQARAAGARQWLEVGPE